MSHLGLEHVGVAQQKNGAIIVDEILPVRLVHLCGGDVTDRINSPLWRLPKVTHLQIACLARISAQYL